MLRMPNLSDSQIIAFLRDSYQIAASGLEFQPGGYDAYATVYRVTTDDGGAYFLKVRKGAVDRVSLIVPRALRDAGIDRVIAPILARGNSEPVGRIGEYRLILYPYLAGGNAMNRGLSDSQWVEYGATLRSIHAATLPDDVRRQVPRESFESAWVRGVSQLQAMVERSDHTDPHARALAAIWKAQHDKITHLVDRADALGRELRRRRFDLVLCHTDPHLANILVDPAGQLFVVDWDAPLLAPKERDLHFTIGISVGRSTIGPREEALIFQGYGSTTIDWRALTYYRYEWICGDLLEFGNDVFTRQDATEEAKDEAIRMIRKMFEPGNAVASADALERRRLHQ